MSQNSERYPSSRRPRPRRLQRSNGTPESAAKIPAGTQALRSRSQSPRAATRGSPAVRVKRARVAKTIPATSHGVEGSAAPSSRSSATTAPSVRTRKRGSERIQLEAQRKASEKARIRAMPRAAAVPRRLRLQATERRTVPSTATRERALKVVQLFAPRRMAPASSRGYTGGYLVWGGSPGSHAST